MSDAATTRRHRVDWAGWLALAVVSLGLYQLGYTGVEWEDIKTEATARDSGLLRVIQDRDGALGYARFYWMTNSDERLYAEYARLTLTGRADLEYIHDKQYAEGPVVVPATSRWWPYRDVRVEYPPVAVAAMVVPGLVSLDPFGYRFGLAALCLGGLALVAWASRRALGQAFPVEKPARRLLWLTLLLGAIVVTRLDVVAVAALVGALWASQRGRPGVAGAMAALGTLTKLFPGLWFLVQGLLCWRDRRWRDWAWSWGAGAAVLVAVNLAMWAWAGSGYLDTYLYHGQRGIQIESTYATVALLVQQVADIGVSLDLSFGSSNLVTPFDGVVQWAWPLAFVALAAPFLWAAVRRSRAPALWPLMGGVLLAFVLANKVFSPQYLLWLMPFCLFDPSPRGRRTTVLFLIACLLSQVLYPRGYDLLKAFHPAAVLVLAARNGLLLAIWWRWTRQALAGPAPELTADLALQPVSEPSIAPRVSGP